MRGNRVVALLTDAAVKSCEYRKVALVNRIDQRDRWIHTNLETFGRAPHHGQGGVEMEET